MSSRATETFLTVVLALAIMLGGRSLLVQAAGLRPAATLVLLVLVGAQTFGLRRDLGARNELGRWLLARDVAFVAATVAALAFVLAPARWSLGASIAAVEFGLVIQLLARWRPAA